MVKDGVCQRWCVPKRGDKEVCERWCVKDGRVEKEEAEEEEEQEPGGTDPKARTPHNDVGKKAPSNARMDGSIYVHMPQFHTSEDWEEAWH